MFCSISWCFSLPFFWGVVLWLQSRETQGLVPVTVKQISEASQSGDEKSTFVINGVDVANVLFTYCFRCFSFNQRYFIALFTRKMYEVKRKKRKKKKEVKCLITDLFLFSWDTGPAFELSFYLLSLKTRLIIWFDFLQDKLILVCLSLS
jgi:hypothetical protein